jgi:hypothetical protein
MGTTIDQHLASPDVSLDEHVRQCQIALAHTLEHKQAIYLDVNFWNIATDALIGTRNNPVEIELLGLLRKLVADGTAFCPISDSTFAEIFKQKDSRTRKATAQLIDELSLGIALIPFEMRVGTELAHFIHSQETSATLYPLDQLVWTKCSYVLGNVHPTNSGFDRDGELALEKAFFDYLWTIPFSDIVERIDDSMPPNSERYESLAARLNAGNAEHANELRSFPHTYSVEIEGAVDVYAEVAVEIFSELVRKATGIDAARQRGMVGSKATLGKCSGCRISRGSNQERTTHIAHQHLPSCICSLEQRTSVRSQSFL